MASLAKWLSARSRYKYWQGGDPTLSSDISYSLDITVNVYFFKYHLEDVFGILHSNQ